MYIIKAIDTLNKTVQFELKQSVSSISLNFGDFGALDIQPIKVKVELVSENLANIVVLDTDLNTIQAVFGDVANLYTSVVPISLGSTFVPKDNETLLVTIDFSSLIILPVNFKYAINTLYGQTDKTLILKKVVVVDSQEVQTGGFDKLFLSAKDVSDITSSILAKNSVGGSSVVKMTISKELLMDMGINGFVPLNTAPDQVITVNGSSTNYLLKY